MHRRIDLNEPEQKKEASQGLFSLGTGMLLSAHITGYILGPLVVLGGFGFVLDKLLGTKPWIMLIMLGVAFITSNVLIYKKSNSLADKIIEKSKQ